MTRRIVRFRTLAAAALAAAAVAIPMALGATPAAASSANPNTPVPVQPGFTAAALPGGTVFGNTPPATPETVSFVLRSPLLGPLEVQAQQQVDDYLSVTQFARQYGQSSSNISALESYLAGFGITTQSYADDLDVVATGTAGDFDSALAVHQQNYHVPAQHGQGGLAGVPAQNVHAINSSPLLPERIAQYVLAVLGLTNYGPFVSQTAHIDAALVHPQRQRNGSACLALTGLPDACNLPSDFASNYGLDSLYNRGHDGQGETLAIVTLAAVDPGAPEYFWQNVANVNRTGTLTVDNVDGGPGAPSGASGSSETDLDIEQSGSLAPGANVIDYQAPNSDYGWADAFFQVASSNVASSVSSSWGLSETALQYLVNSGEESHGWLAAFDEVFAEMALQGQSGFVSSGDDAAYDATGDIGTTNLAVDFPEDSPFITSAGGTTLPWRGTLSGSGGTATVDVPNQRTWGWDYLWKALSIVEGLPLAQVAESAVIGSGGGFSVLEQSPIYQAGVPGTNSYSAVQYLTPTDYETIAPGLYEPVAWNFNPTPSVSRGEGDGRASPDVSTDADPYSGYLLYSPSFAPGAALEGGWGGTSFVAPQLNGSTAVIDSALGHRVGLWNTSIYGFATQFNSPFTPLDQSGTGNDNIFYTGTPGAVFNPGSGLGVPNLSLLERDFASGS